MDAELVRLHFRDQSINIEAMQPGEKGWLCARFDQICLASSPVKVLNGCCSWLAPITKTTGGH